MGLDGREALCWEREGECEHERSERLECLMHEGDGTCQNRCRGLRVRYMASCTHAQPSLPFKKPVCARKMPRFRSIRLAAPPCSLIAQTTICRIAAPFARISSQRCSFTISKRIAMKNHPPPRKSTRNLRFIARAASVEWTPSSAHEKKGWEAPRKAEGCTQRSPRYPCVLLRLHFIFFGGFVLQVQIAMPRKTRAPATGPEA